MRAVFLNVFLNKGLPQRTAPALGEYWQSARWPTVLLALATGAAVLLLAGAAQAQPAEAVIIATNNEPGFYATDDFETFTRTPTSQNFQDVAFGSDGSSEMWIAVANNAMMASSDGYTWTDIWNDLADPAKDDFAADPNDPTSKAHTGLWSVNYGGGVWLVTTGHYKSTCDPFKIQCVHEGWGGVYTSSDGRTWTKQTMPSGWEDNIWMDAAWGPVGGAQGTWLARVQDSLQTAAVSGWGPQYISKSTDGGVTWSTPTSPGSEVWESNGFLAGGLGYGTDATGNPKWLVGGRGVMYTSSNGVSWTKEPLNGCGSDHTNAAHDGVNTWIGIVDPNSASACTRQKSDGGGAWTNVATVPAGFDVNGPLDVAYHPASHTWITSGHYSGGSSGTMISRDGGATFTHPASPPTDTQARRVAARDHPPEPANLATTNMTVVPTEAPADGMATASIVVELRDNDTKRTPAHPYYDFDYEVNLTTDLGTFSNGKKYQVITVSETGDGTFRTTINSTMAGVANITAEIRDNKTGPDYVDWMPITDPTTLQVEFFPTPDPARTIITSNRTQVNATLPANVTVTTYDYEGNLYRDDGHDASDANHDHAVTIETTWGSVAPVPATDHRNGNHSAELNCSTNGTATLTAKIDYSYSTDPTTSIADQVDDVECIDGPIASAALSKITADDDTIQADGIEETMIRIQVVGELGDVIMYDWYQVCLNTTIGTLSSDSDPDQGDCPLGYVNATYNLLDGNYTAKLSGTEGGFATIQGLIDGKPIGDDAVVELLGGVPRVEDDEYETPFGKLLDVAKESGVLVNDTDPEGATGDPLVDLTAIHLTGPSKADSFTLNADGSFTYTPLGGFVGTDSFTYKARDADGDESNDEATVTIAVLPNEAPTIQDDVYTVAFGTTLIVPELQGVFYDGTDEDPEGADLEAYLAPGSSPAGSVVLETNGSFTYTPPGPPYASGTDSFMYNITDGYAWAGPAMVTIHISPNDPPTARDDSYATPFETTLVVPHASNNYKGVLENNDEDDTPEGVALAVVAADTGQRPTAKGGTIDLASDGTFQYTPPALLEGDDWFWYNATDSYEESMAKVSISIGASNNQAPEALDDGVYETPFGTPLVVTAANGVLLNGTADRDDDGDAITAITKTEAPTDQGGKVTLNADGSFTYTPADGFHGGDTFQYKVRDAYAESNAATVTILVKENTPPTVQDDAYATTYETTLVVPHPSNAFNEVLDNDGDTDPESVTLEARNPSTPGNGTVILQDDGSFTYTPDPGFQGQDSFTYEAWDGYDASQATVTINVAENQAPTAAADSASVQEDGSVDIDVVTGSDTDPDPNHDPSDLVLISVSTPSPHGTAVILDAHTIRYEPGDNETTQATFTYTIQDPAGATATATVTVTITADNDAPVANPDGPYHVQQPSTLTVAARGVLANDHDIDDAQANLTAKAVNGPTGFTLHSNGGFTYAPPGGFTGRASFTYQACDDEDPVPACSGPITVLLDVQAPPPRANVAQNESAPPRAPMVPETWIPAEAGGEVFIPAGIRPGSGSNAFLVWSQATGFQVTLVWDAERGGYVFTAPTPLPGQSMDLVFLIAIRDGSRVSEAVEVTVHVDSENTEPVARATARPSRVVAGQEVLLDASESYDPDGQTLSYHWQHIGGVHVELQRASTAVASFVAPRVEDPSQELVFVVVVSDAGGKHALANVTVTYVQSITQETTGNVIAADFRALQRGQGQILFRATGSDAAQYTWDLGDGKTATGPEVLHRYDQGGDFNVQLTVEDDEGTGTASKPVSVPDYVPVQEAKGGGAGWWLFGATVAASLLVIAVTLLVASRLRRPPGRIASP